MFNTNGSRKQLEGRQKTGDCERLSQSETALLALPARSGGSVITACDETTINYQLSRWLSLLSRFDHHHHHPAEHWKPLPPLKVDILVAWHPTYILYLYYGIWYGETNLNISEFITKLLLIFLPCLVIWSCTHSQTLTLISAEKLNLIVFMNFFRYEAWLTMKACTRSQVSLRERKVASDSPHCDCSLVSPGVPSYWSS